MRQRTTDFPLMQFNALAACVDDARGWTPVGRMLRTDYLDLGNRNYLIEWTKELKPGVSEPDAAVFVFVNGEFLRAIPGPVSSFWYRPPIDARRIELELYLLPNSREWERYPYTSTTLIRERACLSWNVTDWACEVRVLGNAGGSIVGSTPVATLTSPVVSLPSPEGSISGVEMEVAGTWRAAEWKYTTVLVAITAGGGVGVATFGWNWVEGGVSGTGVTDDLFQFVVNGLRVRWPAGATVQTGDAWLVEVSLPQSYQSPPLARGQHTYRVDTVSALGTVSAGSAQSIQITAPPAAPTLVSAEFEEGDLTITWAMPDEADLWGYRVRRNRLHVEEGNVYDIPVWTNSALAEAEFTLIAEGLAEGFHRFAAVAVDDQGNESAETVYDILVDATGAAADPPNPPMAITATVNSSGNIAVRVWVDETGDEVALYSNGGSGAVDYDTPAGTIENPQTSGVQSLAADLSASVDGVWLVAARHRSGTYEEANTDVVARVKRDTSATAVSDFVAVAC